MLGLRTYRAEASSNKRWLFKRGCVRVVTALETEMNVIGLVLVSPGTGVRMQDSVTDKRDDSAAQSLGNGLV